MSVAGVDLDCARFINISKPAIAMLVGTGVTATGAGEVWHLMDQRLICLSASWK